MYTISANLYSNQLYRLIYRELCLYLVEFIPVSICICTKRLIEVIVDWLNSKPVSCKMNAVLQNAISFALLYNGIVWTEPIYRLYYIQNFSHIQYNLNGSNPDGSFTVDDSNSFFSPNKILQIAQNKYLGIFSYFIIELYVVCTLNIQSLCRKSKRFP